jgi:hypothetical protein
MYTVGAFALCIQRDASLTPPRVKVLLQWHAPDLHGQVFVTPECRALDELEGYLNGLQDDLDQLRERARRVFQERP